MRIVHWSVMLLVGFAWWTAEYGELKSHRLAGCALLSLVLFRILWGFCGSRTARFKNFLRGPKAAAQYLRAFLTRTPRQHYLGHNPVGGWNVLSLLLLMGLVGVSGLFAVDVDGVASGPLARYVSFDTGRSLALVHRRVFNVLLVLICAHVIGVLTHLFYKQENLIGPMLTGTKEVPAGTALMVATAQKWRAWAGFAGATGIFCFLVWVL